jgi:single-stranded DNA-binding protein
MSVSVLVTGALFRAAEERSSGTGKAYVRATIKAADGEDGGADFWSVLAFGDTARAELLRLAPGDKVALQGKPKFELFEKDSRHRISKTIFADAVLALRAAPRARKPKEDPREETPRSAAQGASPPAGRSGGFHDDDIPF